MQPYIHLVHKSETGWLIGPKGKSILNLQAKVTEDTHGAHCKIDVNKDEDVDGHCTVVIHGPPPAVGAALAEIAELPDDLIRRHQLDVTGGCFNKRKRFGGSRLSVHSWGAAYDLAIGLNGYGEEPDLPGVVVDIFARHGAQWGGYWPTPDGMHFEFVN